MYTKAEIALLLLDAKEEDYKRKVSVLKEAKDPERLLTDWNEIWKSVIKEEQNGVYMSEGVLKNTAETIVSDLESKNYFAVTLCSDDYPKELKEILDPPLVLYGKGNRELLKMRKFAIVGSRVTLSWAVKYGTEIASAVADKMCVVTGFAEGGDRSAIDGALDKNLICVLPNGLDICYPAHHFDLKEEVARKGLLLTEYPPKVGARKQSFHARNRIIAGLSEGVLVLSAKKERSGTFITANCALDYGRDVFALPYNPGTTQGEGCNELLKKGAYVVTSAEDVLSVYGFTAEKAEKVTLSKEEEKVLKLLKEKGELHTAEIASLLGVPVFEVVATLSSLEMKNLAVKAGSNRYGAL